MNNRLSLKIILLCVFACTSNAYRRDDFAICFIGGLNSTYGNPNIIANTIRNAYPDIPFVELRNGDGTPAATQTGLYRQLESLYNFAVNSPEIAGKHVILIGGSQGGLVAQAFIEMYGHLVPFTFEALMTIGSPLAGTYGLPDYWENIVDDIIIGGDRDILQMILNLIGIRKYSITLDDGTTMSLEEAFTKAEITRDIFDSLRSFVARVMKDLVRNNVGLFWAIVYNPLAQDRISIANYWRDPRKHAAYLTGNNFLPYISNEKPHANSDRYRSNLSELNRIVFFWAGRDEVVKPAASGAMCTYKWGSPYVIDSGFEDTMQYQYNLLGLRTMYDNGRLFIEHLPNDRHDCGSTDGQNAALRHFGAIVNDPAPSDIFDAVKANNLPLVQSIVAANPAVLFSKDGFNYSPLYYAGNSKAIAEYLFEQHIVHGQPLNIDGQTTLAYNASGCGNLEVLSWLLEDMHLDPTFIRASLLQIATQNGQPHIVSYLNTVAPVTLHQAIIDNNEALVTQMIAANPFIITQRDASQMLPIYYAGNKLSIAQKLFACHRTYAPLTFEDTGTILYYACGSASLPVAKWIIEDLFFNPLGMINQLLNISQDAAIRDYLNSCIAENRVTLFGAVQQNNLSLVSYIVEKNPANAEEVQQGMLPILYAGNKLEIAKYLYRVHQQLGRPLNTENLNNLLFFTFGAGSLDVARWMIEQLNFDPRPTKDSLIAIAQTNGQHQMITYLTSLGIV